MPSTRVNTTVNLAHDIRERLVHRTFTREDAYRLLTAVFNTCRALHREETAHQITKKSLQEAEIENFALKLELADLLEENPFQL